MPSCGFRNDFVLKIIFTEHFIKHRLYVMAGVPVAVIIQAAGLFQDARQSNALGRS